MKFEVIAAPFFNQIIDHFTRLKPISVTWKGDQGGGFLAAKVRNIIGPGPDTPGRFVVVCDIASPGCVGTLQLPFDYETKNLLFGQAKFTPAASDTQAA